MDSILVLHAPAACCPVHTQAATTAAETKPHSILEILAGKQEELIGVAVGSPEMPYTHTLLSELQEGLTQLKGLPGRPDFQALLRLLDVRQTQPIGLPNDLLGFAQNIGLQDELQSGRQALNQVLEPFFNATSAFGQSYRGFVDVSIVTGAGRGLLDVVTAPLGLFPSGFVSILWYTAFVFIAVVLLRTPRQ